MERAGRLIGKLKVARAAENIEARACAAWKVAAGKRVAGHTRATALVRGTLVVEVEDMVWQQQLHSLRHFLISNLARELGEVVVTDLDFRPMPRRLPPQRAEAARRASPLWDDAEKIGDPVMRGLYKEARKRESA